MRGSLVLRGSLPQLERGAPCGCTLTQDGVLHPAGQLRPASGGGGRAWAPEPHNSPPPKPAGTGAFGRRACCPVTQLAPRCRAQRLPSASLGDCSVFMFHPGLPAAEPASWAGGLRRDPGIRCCSTVPPPSQADVTAAAREAFLLRRCCSVRTGLWDLGSPAVRPFLGCPLCWQGPSPGGFLRLRGFGGMG